MTRLSSLLDQSEPLTIHEQADLVEWLEVLESDCASFGATPEDEQTIERIKTKISS